MRSALVRMSRLATYAAIAGGASGVALWTTLAAGGIDEWFVGTLGSLLAGVLLLLPAVWMLNVRFALAALAELPDTARTVADRGRPGAPVDAARTYLDVTGSWALLAQLVSPIFWIATAVAFASVLLLTAAAMVVTFVTRVAA